MSKSVSFCLFFICVCIYLCLWEFMCTTCLQKHPKTKREYWIPVTVKSHHVGSIQKVTVNKYLIDDLSLQTVSFF